MNDQHFDTFKNFTTGNVQPASGNAGKNAVPIIDNRTPSVQKKANNTGLPDHLKSGIEGLSGYNMDDVKVHYNSSQPAQLNAHAYAQGSDIHIAPGQQKYLPHEAWHLVQQKQGRVKPTLQMHGKINVNDDKALESEADRMGDKAVQNKRIFGAVKQLKRNSNNTIQLAGGWLDWGRMAVGVGATLAGAGMGLYKGVVAGSALGLAGAVAGGVVGAGLGAIGGALAGYAGYNQLSKGIPAPGKKMSITRPPSTGELIYKRAEQLATLNGKDLTNGPLEYLAGPVAEKIRKTRTKGEAHEIIDRHYKTPEAGEVAPESNNPGFLTGLSDLLHTNRLIQQAVNGDFMKGEPAHQSGSSAMKNGLEMRGSAHPSVKSAKIMFDKLVDRKLPPVTVHHNKLDPVSGISSTGALHMGTVAPPGVVLHELGHHLEHNLDPEEFATLHHYLRARSATPALRHVGYEGLLKREQSESGYDVPMPETPGEGSLMGLAANALKYKLGSNKAGENIDEFIISHGNSSASGYASMVYDQSRDTEYLSTTIHYFSNPKKIAQLVSKDPLRIALFMYMANKTEYLKLKTQVAAKFDGLDLDRLIHVVRLG